MLLNSCINDVGLGISSCSQFVLYTKSGSPLKICVRISPFNNSQGIIIGCALTMMPSEAVTLTEAMRENSCPQAIVSAHAPYSMQTVNIEFSASFGIMPQLAVGMPICSVRTPRCALDDWSVLFRSAAAGQVSESTVSTRTAFSPDFPFKLRCVPVVDSDNGRIARVVAIFLPIAPPAQPLTNDALLLRLIMAGFGGGSPQHAATAIAGHASSADPSPPPPLIAAAAAAATAGPLPPLAFTRSPSPLAHARLPAMGSSLPSPFRSAPAPPFPGSYGGGGGGCGEACLLPPLALHAEAHAADAGCGRGPAPAARPTGGGVSPAAATDASAGRRRPRGGGAAASAVVRVDEAYVRRVRRRHAAADCREARRGGGAGGDGGALQRAAAAGGEGSPPAP
jgi:hypothetical protein